MVCPASTRVLSELALPATSVSAFFPVRGTPVRGCSDQTEGETPPSVR